MYIRLIKYENELSKVNSTKISLFHSTSPVFDIVSEEKSDVTLVITLCLDIVIRYYSYLNTSFYLFSFFLSLPPWNIIFYNPKVGAYMRRDNIVATTIDQNISEMDIYTAEYGSQYRSILLENVPPIITIKWTKYTQNETLARGENIL